MSGLNSSETTQMRDVQATLEYILLHGFDPKKADDKDPQAVYTKANLTKARDSVKTITTMKGYYPS